MTSPDKSWNDGYAIHLPCGVEFISLLFLLALVVTWSLMSTRMMSRLNHKGFFFQPPLDSSHKHNLSSPITTEGAIEIEIEIEASKRKQIFLQSTHGKHYGYSSTAKGHIDTWRKREFPSLIQPISTTPIWKRTLDSNSASDSSSTALKNDDDNDSDTVLSEPEVYLDYAGSAIPTKSLLQAIHQQSLNNQILANPHSDGPAASRTEAQIDQVKKEVLDFFQAHAGPKFGYQLELVKKYQSQTYNQHQQQQSQTGDLNDNNDADDVDGDKEEDYHPGYDVIFTSGTTQALQIVAENFAWDNGNGRDINRDDDNGNDATGNGNGNGNSVLVYSHNSHTSVVGMRESAMNHGATFQCKKLVDIEKARSQDFVAWGRGVTSLDQPQSQPPHELHGDNGTHNGHNANVDKDGFTFVEHGGHNRSEAQTESAKKLTPTNHLLVFPLECNFSGTRSNAQHIIRASRRATCTRIDKSGNGKWYSMLDIAKAASTSSINLRKLDPDFACVSFYKIFGAPTGIGALFVKRSSKHLLVPEWNGINDLERTQKLKGKRKERRRYFGGGSVDIQLPTRDFVRLRSSLDSLVHGTINFRSILSLRLGLQEIDLLGMDSVSARIWVYTAYDYNVCIFFS